MAMPNKQQPEEVRKRTLYVIPTTAHEVFAMWQVGPNASWVLNPLFIQCNKAGYINWSKASLYTWKELKTKNFQLVII